MKAIELRIGNKVDCFGIKEVDSVIRSTNGSFKLIVCEKKQSGVSICESVLIESIELKPIPLTEEILLKCGFEKCLNQYKLRTKLDTRNGKNVPFIILDLDGFEYDDLRLQTKLKHVHQLQNLYFALTNEELKIEI